MPKSSSIDDASRTLSDVALRKKKNADAQAAFRARRAAYISTLEATVNNLESIVLSLQESCREARSECQDLRQENARLKLELREREKFWRAVWPRKTGGSDGEDFPPPPPLSQQNGSHVHSTTIAHYSGDNSVSYSPNDDPAICTGQFNGNGHGPYSSSVAYSNDEPSISPRDPKYAPFYSLREGPWQPSGISQTPSSGGESGVPPGSSHSSHSEHFESPQIPSSDMSFVSRYPVEDQKMPMNNVDSNPYEVFTASRSISPTSTSPSASATSLTSPYPFTFNESGPNDRSAEFDYRRHPPHAEVTLHGGTADISAVPADGVRYRLGSRRPGSGSDHLVSVLPPLSNGETGSQHTSSDGDSYATTSRLRARRSAPDSRSPSPGMIAPLSGTLAVIKAQAFGALRRTRARTKKAPEAGDTNAKSSNFLENRSIGAKRPRLDNDDADTEVS